MLRYFKTFLKKVCVEIVCQDVHSLYIVYDIKWHIEQIVWQAAQPFITVAATTNISSIGYV